MASIPNVTLIISFSDDVLILNGLRKSLLNFTTRPRFHFSVEAFSNLHCFILTNFILRYTKWSNYQKSYNNNLNNETKL